jgi:hypothetical protein
MDATLNLLNDKQGSFEAPASIGSLQLASKKQRGYIHGLCKKMNMDESELKYSMDTLTIAEASELIEELKFYSQGFKSDFGRPSAKDYNASLYENYDDTDLPF